MSAADIIDIILGMDSGDWLAVFIFIVVAAIVVRRAARSGSPSASSATRVHARAAVQSGRMLSAVPALVAASSSATRAAARARKAKRMPWSVRTAGASREG